jgi:hypothetical protein
MAELHIDFEWARGPRRYRLVEKPAQDVEFQPPARRRELPKLPGQWGLVYVPFGIRVLTDPAYTPLYVVADPEQDLVQSYRPLDRFGSLYAQFASITTPQDVLSFVEKFGPLTKDGLDASKGELVWGVIIHAEAIQELLQYRSHGGDNRQELAAVLDRGFQVNPFAGLEVALEVDAADQSLKLRLAPPSLLDALWLQAVQELSNGATVRQCRYCGQWFEAGAGTGRRLDAKFCSDQHRIAFNSLKRSKER